MYLPPHIIKQEIKPSQIFLAKESIPCLVDDMGVRVLGDTEAGPSLDQLVDRVLSVRPYRHGQHRLPEFDGFVEAIQPAMSKVKDGLVVAED